MVALNRDCSQGEANIRIVRDWLLASMPLAAVVCFGPSTWPRWGTMWLVAISMFAGLKWLTWGQTPVGNSTPARRLGYLLAWPGLDAHTFLGRANAAPPAWIEWLRAFVNLVAGVILIYLVARRIPTDREYLIGWVSMTGIVLTLHFGSLHLVSCVWRLVGVRARPLMNAPIRFASLNEFWGRRWNTAFRDLTSRFVFRPVSARLGARGAMLVAFAFSGLLHELAISLPAGGGYGGPMLFFMIQGVATLFERSRIGEKLGLKRGLRGRAFTIAALLIPCPLLLHEPFVTRVVLPFMNAIGAL